MGNLNIYTFFIDVLKINIMPTYLEQVNHNWHAWFDELV